MAVKDYNVDPDLNTTIEGINIAEGCPPSGINNAIRQLMADVKIESEAKAEAITAAGEALEAFAEEQAAKDEEQDEEIAGKLDKSGGTVTGPIYADNIAIIGQYENGRLGFSASVGKAATLNLFGRYLAGGYAGAAELIAENDNNRSAFDLFPDGYAAINGSPVLTSAGGHVSFLSIGAADAFLQGIAVTDTSGRPIYEASLGFTNGANVFLRSGDSTGWDQPGMAGLTAQANGQISHFLIYPDGNAYLNGHLVLTAVAVWHDGAGNWYRKYCDGWIEQGGYVTFDYSGIVNLNTAFTTTTYSVFITGGEGNGNAWPPASSSRTTTSFYINRSDSGANAQSYFWYACGY